MHAAAGALCDVDDYLSVGCRSFEGIDEPFLARGISGTECAEYYSFQFFVTKHFLYNLLFDAREEGEDDYIIVVLVMCLELASGDVLLYVVGVVLYACACNAKRRVVV